MHEYPKALYRPGSTLQWEGRDLDMLIVADAAGEAAAAKDGYQTIDDLLADKPAKVEAPARKAASKRKS